MTSLWLLFASAFVSSTLLPGGSEVLFATLVYQEATPPALLFAVAAVGNTLGGMTSWGVGRALVWRVPERNPEALHPNAVARVRRFGAPALLFSWLPIVGDPLCFAAGWLNVRGLEALVFIGLGKSARYGAILWALQ